jgi:hypothetical protein
MPCIFDWYGLAQNGVKEVYKTGKKLILCLNVNTFTEAEKDDKFLQWKKENPLYYRGR